MDVISGAIGKDNEGLSNTLGLKIAKMSFSDSNFVRSLGFFVLPRIHS